MSGTYIQTHTSVINQTGQKTKTVSISLVEILSSVTDVLDKTLEQFLFLFHLIYVTVLKFDTEQY